MQVEEFFQEAPKLGNQFTDDPWLQSFLQDRVPADLVKKWREKLSTVGADAGTDGKLFAWADEAEKNPPKHVPYDAWGKRVDRLEISRAWRDLEAYAATHGLIAEGYERADGAWSRVLQMALLYLYHPSSAIFSCPLAMTDGAARAIEVYGDERLKATALKSLTARDPRQFWTSGQWMTERTGGSDVGQSLTQAVPQGPGYALHGTKWFTSATTSQMAMTLARLPNAEPGGRGLSLFYVELRDANGDLRNIEVHRLKDKLGTKALPTAELSLRGTPAQLVGGEGQGIKKIATLFNITRIYNAVCSIGYMRRALALAHNYATRREVFGKLLQDQPLHVATFFPIWADAWGCSEFVFELVRLLGREECGEGNDTEKALLRLYTPLAKLYTGKKVVQIVSEVLEVFGGAGYVEDTGLPKILRDCQVLPIWEGTTNVLSLDVLRALVKECPLPVWIEAQQKALAALKDKSQAAALAPHLEAIGKGAQKLAADSDEMAAHAREFAMALTEFSIATLMCQRAESGASLALKGVAAHWVKKLRFFDPQAAKSWQAARDLIFP